MTDSRPAHWDKPKTWAEAEKAVVQRQNPRVKTPKWGTVVHMTALREGRLGLWCNSNQPEGRMRIVGDDVMPTCVRCMAASDRAYLALWGEAIFAEMTGGE